MAKVMAAEPSAKRQQTDDVWLVIGASGFFGTYIVRQLLEAGRSVVGFDLRENLTIFSQVLSKEQIGNVTMEYGDVSKYDRVLELFNKYKPSYVIHLAALQIPTCKVRPQLGAMVNVVGTTNVFEAARACGSVKSVVYASSAAVCGPPSDYSEKSDYKVKDVDNHIPRTLYGVFKVCTEGIGRIFWQDHKIASAGLRPLCVFGVGREVGLTSDPTKAIKAAVVGKKFLIKFQGNTAWSWVPDIADTFIRCATALVEKPGAYACNIEGEALSVAGFRDCVQAAMPSASLDIKPDGITLPFPSYFDETTLTELLGSPPKVTPLKDAIDATVKAFQQLQSEGRLHTKDLE